MAEVDSQPATTDEPEQPAAAPKRGGKPTMAVKIFAPFEVFFEGDAYSVSAVNATGPFDILPRHHNFICVLEPCTIGIEAPDNVTKKVKVMHALMYVKADQVDIFVDV